MRSRLVSLKMAFFLIAIVFSLFLSNCSCSQSRIPYKYVIDENQKGTFTVEYEVKDAHKLPLVDGYYLIDFERSTVYCTSDTIQEGYAKDIFFRRESSGALRQIPSTSVKSSNSIREQVYSKNKKISDRTYISVDIQ